LFALALSSAACGSKEHVSHGTGDRSGDASERSTPIAPVTYVLVHGGWHGAWAWDSAVPLLEAAGDVAVAPTLPAHGSDGTPPAQATLDGYVQAVVAAIDAQDQPVVLVGHSMAGAIVSMAAEARPERVRLLVYLAAVLLEDGKSVTSVTANDPESVLGQHLSFNPDGTFSIDPNFARESLYGDCSQADADAAIARLGTEPIVPLATPIHVTDAAWGSVPRIYIHTLEDKAIGPSAQETMYSTLPCQSVVAMQTSHSPFYCGAADFVQRLREAVNQFVLR
jgi:pimeloyl-ACP methyl ester carboxylesterase